jgi:RNA exonuclease 4
LFFDFVIWEWCLGVVSLTKVVAIDCEMVGVGFDGGKSALGRVTLVCTISYFSFLVYLLA